MNRPGPRTRPRLLSFNSARGFSDFGCKNLQWREAMTIIPMTLFQVDDDGLLFISPAIDDWAKVSSRGIDVVIDLEGGMDECIPTAPGECLYVYFPIFDEEL